jgi:hypothetical protein
MDEAQQLLLWRWSTIVQLSSVAMAAAFFALLARINRRPELTWWARAWAFNLLVEPSAGLLSDWRASARSSTTSRHQERCCCFSISTASRRSTIYTAIRNPGDLVRLLGRRGGAYAGRIAGSRIAHRRSEYVQG